MLDYPFSPILNLKSGNKKVKKEKKKRDKEEYQGEKREVVKRKSRILEVSIY